MKFQSGRYINANEAFWRIFEFVIHRHSPPVETLNIHLPNEQDVYFHPSSGISGVNQELNARGVTK
jgi:hypothetical protein